MDLEAVKARILKRAQEAALDNETAFVRVGTRSDIPAWESEVSWVRTDGLREWTGFAGSLQELEQQTLIQIHARELRTKEKKAANGA